MKLHLLVGASAVALALATSAAASANAVSAMVAFGGPIYGRVVNADGTALAGAEIVVNGSGMRVVSDTQGRFTLPGAEGVTTFEVRYLGLPTVSRTVEASGDAAVSLSIVLGDVDAANLDDIVVTGVITDGIARSLNQQRNADGTVNVLSADAIGRYPDPNVAESLQRVQGIAIQRDQGEGRYINVRGAPSAFTAVSVDGVTIPAVSSTTRAVDLDTLPSDIISTVEISKTLSPSQDADSIAGAVNVTTRSPFDTPGFSVSGYAGGSYNDYGGSDTRTAATVSSVFGENGDFGALFSFSFSETNRRPENVENAWNFNSTTNRYFLDETLFKDYETKRTRQAITGALEWRPSEDLHAWLRGSFAEFEDDEYRDTLRLTYSDGVLAPGSTDYSATFTGARIYKQLRHRTQNNQIGTLNLGGEYSFENGSILDATVSFASSEQTYPHRDELVFRSGSRTLSYDTTNHYAPTYSALTDPTGYYLNAANYSFRENTYRSNDTTQDDVAFATNLEVPTSFGDQAVTLKFGAKVSSRAIEADEERFRDRAAAANPGSLSSLLTDRRSTNYDYDLGFTMDQGLVVGYLDQIAGISRTALTRRLPQSLTADYTADEDIAAAYGQARFEMGDTSILAGLRIERTDFEGSALRVPPSGVAETVTVSNDRTDFFPNLTIRHSFSENLIGRFALTRAISRPEYSEIVPRVLETTEGNTITFDRGNPDLEAALSNNFDAGLEYYMRPLGVVSVNAFYKDLSDYRFTLNTVVPYLDPATPAITQAVISEALNAPDGYLAGIEFNWQQTFDFLPGWASGFGVFANYTLTDAEIKTAATYAGRDTFTLPGQSDSVYNVAVFYERYGLSARLSYTHRGDFLEEIDATRPGLDLWVEGRGQLDFTSSYDFGNGIELFGEAKNLGDSAGVRYFGSRERTYEYEKFGYNLFLGLRFKL